MPTEEKIETEIKVSITFTVPGPVSKGNAIDWLRYHLGMTGTLKGTNKLKDIEMRQISEMEDFNFEVKTHDWNG